MIGGGGQRTIRWISTVLTSALLLSVAYLYSFYPQHCGRHRHCEQRIGTRALVTKQSHLCHLPRTPRHHHHTLHKNGFEFHRLWQQYLHVNAELPQAPNQEEAQAGLQAMQQSMQKLNPEILDQGGLLIATQPDDGKEMLRNLLEGTYLKIEFERYPEIRMLNVEPPVFRLPSFISKEECQVIINYAQEHGEKLQDPGDPKARVVHDFSSSWSSSSSTEIKAVTGKIKGLLGLMQQWEDDTMSKPAKMGKLAIENPRMLEYGIRVSQYGLDDGLMLSDAFDQKYQRRMKVRIELNDDHGGQTYFSGLQFPVKPDRGDLTITFPAYKNNLPDARISYDDEAPQNAARNIFEAFIIARVERMAEIQKQSGANFVSHPSMMKDIKKFNKEQEKAEDRMTRKSLRKARQMKGKGDGGSGFGG